jgi:hypothetical protein
MYDFYPDFSKEPKDPRHVAPFVLRVTQQEAAKWGEGLDPQDERDMRETMTADRLVSAPVALTPSQAMPELVMPVQTPVQRSFDSRG